MGKTGIPNWQPIPGFPGYEASDNGDIRSLKGKTPRILKPIPQKDGYWYVFLYTPKSRPKVYVQRAVLAAFCGEPPAGQEARHLDGNRSDNRLENLAWGTPTDNCEDKRRHGTLRRGETTGTHKLTPEAVLAIRQEYGTATLRALGKKHGVSHTAIRRAAIGITWSHLEESDG
jgi:hypothetical protein